MLSWRTVMDLDAAYPAGSTVTHAKRWRGVNAVLILVILAGAAVAVVGFTRHRRAAPAAASTAQPSSSPVPSSPVASAPVAVKPTRAHLCTFLSAGDFQALGVPSPAFAPQFGPGSGHSPVPGQLTCSTNGVNEYATFWAGPHEAAYERARFASQKALYVRGGWTVRTVKVPGAVEAMWIAQDELPTVPLTPAQQAALWGHTDTYEFNIQIPRGTPNPGPVLQALAGLLVARITQLGYTNHSPTDGMS